MVTLANINLPEQSRRVSSRLDFGVISLAIGLAFFGVLMVYSATKDKLHNAGLDPQYFLKRQGVFLVLGIVVMLAVAAFDYRRIEQFSTILYLGTVFALLAVLSPVGSHALGSQRWFSLGPLQLQPSEFATLVLIVAMSTYCARRPDGLDFRDLVRLVLLAGIPILMVLAQPDLGTSILLVVILLTLLVAAGMPGRYLGLLCVVGLIGFVLALKLGLVQHYQIQRLTSFISPNAANANVTYNVNEAKNAIAHGGIFGQGLFRGTQTNLAYVPEQQTDFIFSAVGEQLGFVGAGLLITAYGLVAWRVLRTAQMARDTFGRLLCTGVFALLVFSVFENVGMNMAIMPVAGIPLPFLSYGGSAMISFFAAIGLTVSVHRRSLR
jgi:rod shape determining protein RodA